MRGATMNGYLARFRRCAPVAQMRKMPARKRGDRRRTAGTKRTLAAVWRDSQWTVTFGELRRPRGRPKGLKPLFKAVGEKLPFDALRDVRRHLRSRNIPLTGVYIAHDSMGVPRYIGRGNIFPRLKRRRARQLLELVYFSFYVVTEKTHEREVETLLIRAAGTQLHFNTRKKRVDIQSGSVRDYEAGTFFYERRYRRGKKPKRPKTSG